MTKKAATIRGRDMGESHHSAWCKTLLIGLGWVVYSTEQGVRGQMDPTTGKWNSKGGTRQTPGFPDLVAGHTRRALVLFFEVKPPKQAASAKTLLTKNPLTLSASNQRKHKNALAQADFHDLISTIYERRGGAGISPILVGYGSLPELVQVIAPHFDADRLRELVNRIGCPRDVHDDALAILEPSPTG